MNPAARFQSSTSFVPRSNQIWSRSRTCATYQSNESKGGENMTVKIVPNDKGNPPGKLADAELHFQDGPLHGLKLSQRHVPGPAIQRERRASELRVAARNHGRGCPNPCPRSDPRGLSGVRG